MLTCPVLGTPVLAHRVSKPQIRAIFPGEQGVGEQTESGVLTNFPGNLLTGEQKMLNIENAGLISCCSPVSKLRLLTGEQTGKIALAHR